MNNRKQKKKSRKKGPVIFMVILIIIAVLGIAAALVFWHYYGMTKYEDGSGSSVSGNSNGRGVDPALVDSTGLSDSEADDMQKENDKAIENTPVTLPNDADVYNLLLVGVDRRDSSWNGNSDSMILVSVNKKTKKITMMSFMRDLYANVPGHGVRKLNAACAYGGCKLLVETIEKNYKVHIDNYAWVDFGSMIQVVDAVGGVDLTISDAEAQSANGSIKEMCSIIGKDPEPEYFKGGGNLHCDGVQAVAYGRIRHVGNADYQRTERQRIIMTKIIQKARNMSLGELNSFANTVLPLVHHNIEATTVLSLTASAPSILKYDVVESRVPYDKHFTVRKEILNPDMSYTIQRIQQELYG